MTETTPMTLVHARAMIDRVYSETGKFQWAREAAVNAIEAGATKIRFGLDRNGVRASTVYRRYIADDGCGMDEDELVTFFRTLGGSSKAVGGVHENYGIGAKIALLPWNTAGLVVCSWKNGEGNAIWAKADDATGEYGLRKVQLDDEIVDVWPVGEDPDLGFDLDLLRPPWLEDHGTVLLLLGDSLEQHTIQSDPRHDLSGTRQLRDYLTRRFWNLPDGLEIRVDEMPQDNPAKWDGADFGTSRLVPNASRDIESKADASGVVEAADGTKLRWFLRTGVDEPSESWFWQRGFIAALYKNELYEHKAEHYDYRAFGVAHANVRRGLWVIAEPPLADHDRRNGAFPESDRNSLLWNKGSGENTGLPWNEWGLAFVDDMPGEVRAALAEHRRTGELNDDTYKQRLADLFGSRFKMHRLVTAVEGALTVLPTGNRRKVRRVATNREDGSERQVKSQKDTSGRGPGESPAENVTSTVALPRWEACGADDLETGMLAAYSPQHPNGPTVLVNVDHSVITDQVAHWTAHYPHDPETVKALVHDVYGECAVAAIAHSEQLKAVNVDRRTIRDEVRSPAALTLALLGLMPHDRLISDRLAGQLGARRHAVAVPG